VRAHASTLRGVITKLRAYDPKRRIVVPVAPMIDTEDLAAHLGDHASHVQFWHGDALAVLSTARAALIASGTAVTEAILAHTPMVVVYKVSPLSYALARHLIKIPHVAMANVLAGERVVDESLQQACH